MSDDEVIGWHPQLSGRGFESRQLLEDREACAEVPSCV